ncbi:MAG: hypothetical protein O4965_20325 [Trichodesmium sp. St19_bin1]|nr:hypothetical protein [Trichodesmium sp. St19_bin1]
MSPIKQILMGIAGAVVLSTIVKPSNAITFTIGVTTISGQGQFSSLPGVTTIDFESGALLNPGTFGRLVTSILVPIFIL